VPVARPRVRYTCGAGACVIGLDYLIVPLGPNQTDRLQFVRLRLVRGILTILDRRLTGFTTLAGEQALRDDGGSALEHDLLLLTYRPGSVQFYQAD